MTETIFRALQERLDQYSMGFPATESGIEIDILKKLFSHEEADIFLNLSPKLESPAEVAERTGTEKNEIEKKLVNMAEKGLLFSLKKGDLTKYGAIPFVHGLFEFQIKRMDEELAKMVRKYMDEEFKENLSSSLSDFLRVIPVQKSVDTRSKVAPYEDAIELLKKADTIVITDCACRKSSKLAGSSCEKPSEVCFMFGSMAKYYLDHNMGRKIDVEEGAEILKIAHESGLVTQPATSQNPSGMCNCCGDCCGPLTSLKDHPKPAEMVFSNYFAGIDNELCTVCGTCADRCQTKAIKYDGENPPEIDHDRCIGCGLCVTTCPTDALILLRKEDDSYKVPPANSLEQMIKMAQKRGVI